ncbi:hypothetical protein SASPL_141329 [Salvia splendens]|uniref:Retrovirus-related Pol polyprotein from transposon TNT 1-94-like beta-barrel domain-containing protein n=1 Tax=Salvia splendens TaxID=180675 RepID=A0A8X8WSA5_SALSN|nr:hypothetical protein SASPL_141329 [Salvia splendens]
MENQDAISAETAGVVGAANEKREERRKTDEKDDEWVTLDEKAHSTIMLCLSNDVIIKVTDQETTAALWTKYAPLGSSGKFLLDLRNVDVKVEDEDAALTLLVSLPESYENFVESFMTGKETLSLEDKFDYPKKKKKEGKKKGANGSATVAETDDTNSEESLALVADEQPHCNDVWILDSGASYHLCPHMEYFTTYEQMDGDNITIANSVVCDETNSEESLALVADEQPHCNDVWILDSGASYHLCPHMEYFTTYEQMDGDNITMANSVVCKVLVIGSIKIRTHDVVFYTLSDVRHVQQMTKNLISLSTFDSKGLNFKGEGTVDIASSEIPAEDMTKLWHMRLGHMGERGI